MPVLCPETGYNLGEKTELFLMIKWLLLLKKLKEMGEPINPQRITAVFVSGLNLPLGEVLDTLHITREADRMHLIGMMSSPFEE